LNFRYIFFNYRINKKNTINKSKWWALKGCMGGHGLDHDQLNKSICLDCPALALPNYVYVYAFNKWHILIRNIGNPILLVEVERNWGWERMESSSREKYSAIFFHFLPFLSLFLFANGSSNHCNNWEKIFLW